MDRLWLIGLFSLACGISELKIVSAFKLNCIFGLTLGIKFDYYHYKKTYESTIQNIDLLRAREFAIAYPEMILLKHVL